MPFIITGGQSARRLVPQGLHAAVCTQVIDMGTQVYDGKYGAQAKRKVKIGWEIADADLVDDEGRPAMIWANYTQSTNEKAALRIMLENWRGRAFTPEEIKAFNIENILGVPCMLNVVHHDKGERTYDDVAGVTPLPKNMPKPVSVRKPFAFFIDEWNQEVFDTFGDGLKAKIMESPEAKAKVGKPISDPQSIKQHLDAEYGGAHQPVDEDSIPF